MKGGESGDALVVINAINRLALEFTSNSISHVKRADNVGAHLIIA